MSLNSALIPFLNHSSSFSFISPEYSPVRQTTDFIQRLFIETNSYITFVVELVASNPRKIELMGHQPTRSDQRSIKYRSIPLKGVNAELSEAAHEGRARHIPEIDEKSCSRPYSKFPEVMSTNELISVVGQVWDYASCSIPVLQSKSSLKSDYCNNEKENILGIIVGGENDRKSIPTDSEYFSVKPKMASNDLPLQQLNFELLKVAQKISAFDSCTKKSNRIFFVDLLHHATPKAEKTGNRIGISNRRNSCDMRNVYGWMNGTTYRPNYPVKLAEGDDKSTEGRCIRSNMSIALASCCGEELQSCSSATGTSKEGPDCCPDSLNLNELSMDDTGETLSRRKPITYLSSDDSINSSDNYEDAPEKSQHRNIDDKQLENESELYAIVDVPKTKVCSAGEDKSHYGPAKQEHALAGALAGVCVSLSLHPVDTIKTVIQSCRADQKSVFDIGKSIISERGLTGLYRGIASNVASSAPISAVYTFTYETVKGALLPLIPKEYGSLAHCTAGGCASIATSFIFTPSERIKQQMQVGSHYQNCWNAMVGVIRKGGLPSLYAGWGAVLCRNIPHSIIKFYAYENLKQMVLPSAPLNSQPSTVQTLFCGGVAGSTAALFTTPFDVVKTRLQTQAPGALSQYNSVFHAIGKISKYEGLRGLYRGLTPRLVMYMSQGALFFTSYEFFKHVISLEASQSNT